MNSQLKLIGLALLVSVGMLFSNLAFATGQDEDEDDSPVASAMMLYLMFAEPEACAQLYPQLRKNVDLLRSRFALQVSGGRSSDPTLGKSEQLEVAACLARPSALDRPDCTRLTSLLATAANGDDDLSEREAVEMESLIAKGRPMLGRCPDEKERELRRKYGVN